MRDFANPNIKANCRHCCLGGYLDGILFIIIFCSLCFVFLMDVLCRNIFDVFDIQYLTPVSCMIQKHVFVQLLLNNKYIKWRKVKVAVSRDFWPFFSLRESNPPGPLINRLNWFCGKIRFREDVREKRDSGVRLCAG